MILKEKPNDIVLLEVNYKMKKILIVCFTLYFSFVFAQKELTFKVNYKPETNYKQTIEQNSESKLKYIGSDNFLQKLKEKEIQNPTITNTISKNQIILRTGKLLKTNSFPITMEFVNMTNSEGKKPIPDGTIIYGKGTIDDLPKLDSIVSKNMDEDYKKILLQTLQNTLSQLNFPVKKMKIGDSFSQETPLSIPILGIDLKMSITTNYKLISILNNKGNFDVDVIYTLESKITKFDITASGHGNGKLIYDIENNFLDRYQTNNEMEMFFKTDKFDMEIKSKTGFIQTVEVSNK